VFRGRHKQISGEIAGELEKGETNTDRKKKNSREHTQIE
jgi:hypothetical protein